MYINVECFIVNYDLALFYLPLSAASSSLAVHMLTHNPARHTCSVCGKKFRIRGHMTRHMTIHTGEKEYACTHCKYQCNTLSNLRKHVWCIHKVRIPLVKHRVAPPRSNMGGRKRVAGTAPVESPTKHSLSDDGDVCDAGTAADVRQLISTVDLKDMINDL